jgi:hypothetical protein
MESLTEDKTIDFNSTNPKEFQNNLVLFQQSLERLVDLLAIDLLLCPLSIWSLILSFSIFINREFDQKRLELLESKDLRIKKLQDEIEKEIGKTREEKLK